MGVRLKDIASELNVSISTVSYALNGGPRVVPEDVRQRVLAKAAELGYRPNRIARSLAAGRTMTIGVVSFILTPGTVTSPYFQGCFGGIVQICKGLDYDILLYTHDAEEPDRLTNILIDGRADGLVFVAPFAASRVLQRISEAGVPFVVISGDFEGEAPSFLCDNESGIDAVVGHLFDLGHRDIAHFAGDPTMADGIERREAFCKAMNLRGLPYRENWIVGHSFWTEKAYQTAISFLTQPSGPSAIVCANDEIAAGVYRAAWELGIRVPEQLSITGFDDSAIASILLPGLTTVRQPIFDMGAVATSTLMKQIDGENVFGQRFTTELIVRQSTSRPMKVLT